MFSSETREEAICRLYESGHTIRQIRKLTGIRFARVKYVTEYFDENHAVPPPKNPGRPSKIKNDILSKIITLTVNDRAISCWQISKSLKNQGIADVSSTTVWRERIKLGFEFKPPKIRQKLNDLQKERRLDFAYSMLNSELDLSKIVFSDESRFSLRPDETVNDNPLEYQTLRQWTAEEDEILIEKTQIFGKQWSLLSKFFHCRTPLSIRKRYYYLYKH